MTSAIETLAAFVVDHPKGHHPETAIARAENAFLDTIGCMIVGANASEVTTVISAAASWGSGSAPVYGTDVTLPAPWAALANGVSAHVYDLDDYTLAANDHASAVLVPAVLGACAQRGDDVPGSELIDAYLIGLEVIFRLGGAVNMGHYNLGWHTTSTLDSFGATAAVCRLWGLDAHATASALSLTTSMGSGYTSQFGTMGKPLHAGFSAKTGIVAASLAKSGATGYLGALDGKVSFASLMVPPGQARFPEELAKLGNPWGIEEYGLGAKAYPSCGYTHRAIDCAISLHEILGITSADEIERVSASLVDFHLAILPFHVPTNRTEALFSTAYCVATTLATGGCRIPDFTDASIAREDVRSLTSRVTVTSRNPKNPAINLDRDDPDTVEVVMKDGRSEEVSVGIWTGAPGRDFTRDQFIEKFKDCVEFADNPGFGDRQANNTIGTIMQLGKAGSYVMLTRDMRV